MLSVNEPIYIKNWKENNIEGYTPNLIVVTVKHMRLKNMNGDLTLLYFSRFNFYFVFNKRTHVYSF